MGTTLTGAAASYCALQTLQDGRTALVLTALPAGLDAIDSGSSSTSAGTVREVQAGYGNTPHDTAVTLRFQGRKVGTGPILVEDMTPVVDRTFTPSRTPIAKASTGVGTNYPVTATMAMDGDDTGAWWIDLSKFLTSDEPLDTISRLLPTNNASLLGISIDGGVRRPRICRSKKLIEFRPICATPSDSRLAGEGTYAGISLSIVTGETIPSVWDFTIALLVRNR